MCGNIRKQTFEASTCIRDYYPLFFACYASLSLMRKQTSLPFLKVWWPETVTDIEHFALWEDFQNSIIANALFANNNCRYCHDRKL